MRRMSRWIFCARWGTVECVEGRIIQRRMCDIVRGLRGVEERAWRKFGMGDREGEDVDCAEWHFD